MHFLNMFFFDIYPYIAGTVFWWEAGCAMTMVSTLACGLQPDAGSQGDEPGLEPVPHRYSRGDRRACLRDADATLGV